MAEYLKLHPVDPQPRLIRQAAEVLRGGGLIAYPTDSCYALGWHLGDSAALERVQGPVRRLLNETRNRPR